MLSAYDNPFVPFLFLLSIYPAYSDSSHNASQSCKKEFDTWSVAWEFGKRHDAKMWVVHYSKSQDFSWNQCLSKILKKYGSQHNIGLNEISQMNYVRWMAHIQKFSSLSNNPIRITRYKYWTFCTFSE